MRRSARFTKRVGHTLLEVMIAMAIFAIVFGVALQQINDSTEAARFSTVQADLRRIGQDVLSRIAQDLRCTSALYFGVTSNSNGSAGETLNLVRVVGYNASTGNIFLDTSPAGATPTASNVIYTQYTSKNASGYITKDGLYQRLIMSRTIGTGTPMNVSLTEELLPNNGAGGTNGFTVKVADSTYPWSKTDPFATGVTGGLASPNPTPITATSTFPSGGVFPTQVFSDEPLMVAVQLVFRRRMGMSKTGYTDPNNLDSSGNPQTSKYTYCYVRMQTEVQVRASGNY